MQGISVFDGKWSNIEILNNYIRTDAWHGIALYGARDSRIELPVIERSMAQVQ